MVLNDKQRVAKRQLIEENREKRKMEEIRAKIIQEVLEANLTQPDRLLIQELVATYHRVLAPQYTRILTVRLNAGVFSLLRIFRRIKLST